MSTPEKAAYQAAWYQRNKERIAVQQAEWVRNNREQVNATATKRYQKNKLTKGGRMSDKRKCLNCGVDISFRHGSALRCGSWAQRKGCSYTEHSTWKPERRKQRTKATQICRLCDKPTGSGHKKYCGDKSDKTSCNYKRYLQHLQLQKNRTKPRDLPVPNYQTDKLTKGTKEGV